MKQQGFEGGEDLKVARICRQRGSKNSKNLEISKIWRHQGEDLEIARICSRQGFESSEDFKAARIRKRPGFGGIKDLVQRELENSEDVEAARI